MTSYHRGQGRVVALVFSGLLRIYGLLVNYRVTLITYGGRQALYGLKVRLYGLVISYCRVLFQVSTLATQGVSGIGRRATALGVTRRLVSGAYALPYALSGAKGVDRGG